MLQVAFPQAEATRGMALNVRLVEEAGPGGLVLSAGLMSGPGALLQRVTALRTCPPAVCRTWPCVLSTLSPEARRRHQLRTLSPVLLAAPPTQTLS